MTATREKAPKKKRTARKKRWGPAPAHHEKPAKRAPGRLKPISLHPLDFETAVRALLAPIVGRKPKPRAD